ncbi:uncharacterized protein [Palaemon carinicauda]|uniref:uncharacterized protein isoform X3 n=1 Tax=Palaemon carinicauda TaxID=392227 RepID=UPI0035B5E4DD
MPPHQIENDYWQDGLHSSLHRLSALYNLSKLSDLTISFPNCMESLKVHRLILAMSSPVFEAMFYGPMAVKGDLILPEDPPQAFTILVSYIYENQVPLRDVDTAVKVYHLASKYQMNHLSSLCSQYIEEHVDLDNLVMIYELSLLFEDSKLKKRCRKVVKDFSVEILSSPWLGQLTQQCMKDLLQQKLCADEVSVFKGLLQWGASQSKSLSRSIKSHKGLRQQIETLLPHVRFLTMTSEDFERHVMPLNILTSDEKNAILKNLKQDGSVSLPAICSPERVKRIFYSKHQYHHVALNVGNSSHDEPYKITPNKALRDINKRKEERAETDEEDSDSEDNDCDYYEVHGWDCYMEEFSEESDSYEISQDSIKKDSSAPESHLENYPLNKDSFERNRTTEFLSGLKINKDIHVSCIKWMCNDFFRYKTWDSKIHLVIKSSSGNIVGETRVKLQRNVDGVTFSAFFKSPLVLISSDVYSILLLWFPKDYLSPNIFSQLDWENKDECYVSYGDLKMEGIIITCMELNLSIEFWCFSKLF